MNSQTQRLEDLLELASNNLRKLQPDNRRNGAYTVSVSVANYSESLLMAADLIKMCILSNEAQRERLYTFKAGISLFDISGIMELVLQLLPIAEVELLDELQVILKERGERE